MINTCLCGCSDYQKVDMPACKVEDSGTRTSSGQVVFGRCQKCGVVRQVNMPFSSKQEFVDFYRNDYPPNKASYEAKDYGHDLNLARKRADAYGVAGGQKILDVGSGSGAFVDECRTRGNEAFGCEIGLYSYEKDGQFIYRQPFEDIHFPTDHFDLVTSHDVLEHSLDPVAMLDEAFRVTKQGGAYILDFPRFFDASGEHHWKDAEHAWLFTTEQLKELLEKAGFMVSKIEHPIESKTVFYCTKPEQKRPTILVPPGIGDSYWSIIRLESFLAQEKIGIPEIIPASLVRIKSEARERSIPFLQLFPFLCCNRGLVIDNPEHGKIWQEAYLRQGRTIWRNPMGFDYFLCWNGYLKEGIPLESIDPFIECNWHPKMWVSLEEENYRREARAQWGKYVVFYFPFHGSYKYWTAEFPVDSVVDSVKKMASEGYTPLIVGATWDHGNPTIQHLVQQSRAVDLTGQTSIPQLFGLMKGSEAVVGYPSGITILAGVLRVKTLIIWNSYYNSDFAWNTLPPDVRHKTYFTLDTKGLTVERLTGMTLDIIAGKTHSPPLPPPPPPTSSPRPTHRKNVRRVLVPIQTAEHLPARPPRPTTIACVLKTGGDFDARYVVNLKRALDRNLTHPFKFVCLTDDPKVKDVETIRLTNGHPGWWAKIELFRSGLADTERVLYFDLDTLILDNIDDMLALGQDFYALRPWNEANLRAGKCASGVMAWKNGAYDFLYDEFDAAKINCLGDQAYISAALRAHGGTFTPLQDAASGIYSYKRECRRGGPPNDARIVCFHGRPRIHECQDKWVKGAWR